jgi:hypothetical protein
MGTVQSVTQPVVWLAVMGAIWAVLSGRFPVVRVAAVALGLYVLVTIVLSGSVGGVDFIQQLEAPRLMPYQRMLMLYLAAFFIVRLIDVLASLFRIGWQRDAGAVVVGIIVLVVFIRPVGDIGSDYQGLQTVPTISMNELGTLEAAVTAADNAAPEGTAILVLGTNFSWHERQFAVLDTNRPLYYEHWLWGWNDEHQGPADQGIPGCTFNNDEGNYYPCPELTLTPEYLTAHGIGAVVVTNVVNHPGTVDAREAASTSTALQRIGQFGAWDAYSVISPVPLIVYGPAVPDQVSIDDQDIRATFTDGSGDILVKVNWFPRWQATVNGEKVDVTRTDGGYMRIAAPAGPVELHLAYAVTVLDWLNRILACIALIVTAALASGRPRAALQWMIPQSQ